MSIAYANPDDLPPSSHIEVTPGVCGGKPCVAGTRIRVQDIVIYYDRFGQMPEEIISRYPQLSLSDVHAALAYYFDHREAIDAQMREGQAVIEEARRLFPSKLPTRGEREK